MNFDYSKIIQQKNKTFQYSYGLNFLKTNDIEYKYLSFSKGYDELLFDYIKDDFMVKDEINFLQNGIVEFYKNIAKTEAIELRSEEEIRNNIIEIYTGRTEVLSYDHKTPMSEDAFEKYVKDRAKKERKQLEEHKELAIYVLNYELIDFKIKLARMGVTPVFKSNEVYFVDERSLIDKPTPVTLETEVIEPEKTNPYPKYFNSVKAFEMFEKWHNLHKENKTPSAYSFITRKMMEDGHLHNHLTPQAIMIFLSENYDVELDKLLTLRECFSQGKLKLYNSLSQ